MGNYYSNPQETKENNLTENISKISNKHYEYFSSDNIKNQIELKKFDLSRISKSNTMTMIGRGQSGKSKLIQKILSSQKDIQHGSIYSDSKCDYENYKEKFPFLDTSEKWTEEDCKKYIDLQITRKCEKQNKIINNCKSTYIIDGIDNDTSWIKSKYFKQLMMNRGCYETSLIFTSRYPLGIHLNLIKNIDYVFIFKDNINNKRKCLYHHYAGMFNSFEDFNNVMDNYTDEFNCIVIDNTTISRNFEDQVFYYNSTWPL